MFAGVLFLESTSTYSIILKKKVSDSVSKFLRSQTHQNRLNQLYHSLFIKWTSCAAEFARLTLFNLLTKKL